MSTQYEKENDALFTEFVEEYYMKYLRGNKGVNRVVELYISSDCNMACSYCYLHKNRDKIYPSNLCDDPNAIIKNIGITLDWFLDNKVQNIVLNLFSGEFFKLPYWEDVLQIIFDKTNGTNLVRGIGIPSNMSFISDDTTTSMVEEWIGKFKSANIPIKLSASIDGPFEEKNRPLKDGSNIYDDSDFYHKVFAFCSKYDFGFHPMVSAKGIEYWIDNHKFFLDMLDKYGGYGEPMTLEVRDDNWTDESLDHYIGFLDYMFERKYEELGRDNEKMGMFIFKNAGHRSSYNPLALFNRSGKISCSIQDSLFIRVGDMSIVPCHRLSYKQLNYGKFVIEDDKITGVKAGNVSFMSSVLSLNTEYHNTCVDCGIKMFCVKGCLGSQYETNGDPFTVNETVCDLYRTRVAFILKKMIEVGMLVEIIDREDIISYEVKEVILSLLERMSKYHD